MKLWKTTNNRYIKYNLVLKCLKSTYSSHFYNYKHDKLKHYYCFHLFLKGLIESVSNNTST